MDDPTADQPDRGHQTGDQPRTEAEAANRRSGKRPLVLVLVAVAVLLLLYLLWWLTVGNTTVS
jgi:multidrug resistance efflux pump